MKTAKELRKEWEQGQEGRISYFLNWIEQFMESIRWEDQQIDPTHKALVGRIPKAGSLPTVKELERLQAIFQENGWTLTLETISSVTPQEQVNWVLQGEAVEGVEKPSR